MSSTGGAGEFSVEAALTGEAAQLRRAAGEQQSLDLDPEARAIAEAAGELDGGAGEDLDTLGLPHVSEIQAIMAELECDVFQAVREHTRRAGKGGRKKGSRNRRNEEFRRFILASGGHPGIFLQRVYDRPTEILAAELGCSKRDALDRQIRCASELMPFVEGKQPATVNLAVRGDMVLQAAAGTGLFDGLDDFEDAEFDELPGLAFPEQNQPLDEGEEGGSE